MIRDPNEVREAMAPDGSEGKREGPEMASAVAPAASASGKRSDVLKSITASYFFLRRGLAILAIAFPFALFALAGIQESLSAYYHCTGDVCGPSAGDGKARDVLVGVLWATATFLIFYRGYTRKEDWALNLAGVAAAGVAFFPSDFPAIDGRSPIGKIHFTSGLVFFLAIAFVCLFCAKETLKELKDEAKVRRFKRTYAGLGTLMVAVPLAVLALHFLRDKAERSYYVLGIELAGLFVFAAFWLFKSKEVSLIEKQ
ncbi:MAG TPA: hypothetical protein VIT45_18400 [Allosphingosinicella sp.]